MELEEAIKQCNNLIAILPNFHLGGSEAIETVLQALKNSIPEKKIQERIKQLEEEKKDNPDFATIQAIILDYENMLEDK